MSFVINIIMVAITAIFLENTILTRAIGTSTVILASKNKNEIIPFGLSITYICTTASALSFLADMILADNKDKILFMPIIYVLIVGLVYIVTLLVMWKWMYELFINVKKFIHLSAFNCAVLGALFFNSMESNSFIEYIVFGIGTGLGFFIASYLIAVSYEKLNSPEVPQAFRGLPATLIYLGILSMVFFAVTGKIPQI